jgi:hypothetical protein
MNKEQLKRIFEFLEKKENKLVKEKGTLRWKIVFNEPLTEEDFNRYGDLDLSNLEITSLPEGLKVHRDLDLYNSKIKILPKGLEVWGDLYVTNTDLEDYTKEQIMIMIQPGFIKGDIIYDMGNESLYADEYDEDEDED